MSNLVLANRIWPEVTASNLVRNAALAVVGSIFVAAAAQITVPMWPVPMTLQTFAVLAVGGAYGARLGAITLGLYLLEGLVGLPFFAGGQSGFLKEGVLISSGGYIVGFILAAWLVGRLFESGWANSWSKMILAALAGAAVLYVPGLIWLAVWAAKTQVMDAGTAISSALSWGLYPFIVGDIIKAAVAGLAVFGGLSMTARKG